MFRNFENYCDIFWLFLLKTVSFLCRISLTGPEGEGTSILHQEKAIIVSVFVLLLPLFTL